MILLKHYDPLAEPEFGLLMMDIFYALLGMQNYQSQYPLLSIEIHQAILERLIRTLALSTVHLLKNREYYELYDSDYMALKL